MFPPAHSDGRRSCSRISWRCFSNMRKALPKGTPARIVQKLAQKIDGLQTGEPKPTQAACPRR